MDNKVNNITNIVQEGAWCIVLYVLYSEYCILCIELHATVFNGNYHMYCIVYTALHFLHCTLIIVFYILTGVPQNTTFFQLISRLLQWLQSKEITCRSCPAHADIEDVHNFIQKWKLLQFQRSQRKYIGFMTSMQQTAIQSEFFRLRSHLSVNGLTENQPI